LSRQFLLMNLEHFRTYCFEKKGVTEEFPFDENTLVFKVMGKMFAATNLQREVFTVNLKCDPEWAIELREEHQDILPGFHMNKKHWNTIQMEGELKGKLIIKMIDHSYDRVVLGMTKKLRTELESL